jgi:hypothetical protein
MDLAELTVFLALVLPYLLKGTSEADAQAGKRFGAASWEHAGTLWRRLSGSVEEHPAARDAARDLALKPDDTFARKALYEQIGQLLAADPQLRTEVEQLWQEAKAAGATAITTTTSGKFFDDTHDTDDTKGTAFPTGPGDKP